MPASRAALRVRTLNASNLLAFLLESDGRHGRTKSQVRTNPQASGLGSAGGLRINWPPECTVEKCRHSARVSPATDRDAMSPETSVGPKTQPLPPVETAQLADAVDAASGIRVRTQSSFASSVLLEVQQPNRTRTDQTACKRWFGHDHHGIQERRREPGCWNESNQRVADRSRRTRPQHHSGGLGVFVRYGPSRNLHQELIRPEDGEGAGG